VKRKRVSRKQRQVLKNLKVNRGLHCLVLLCVGFVLVISACGGSSPPSSLPQKGKSPAIAKKVESTKVTDKKEGEKKEEAEYAYNPLGKPDPFKPFIQMTPSKEYSRRIPQTPLQKYEISQLILVAIIMTPEGNIALVEDSAGKGYFLKKGTEIGKNDGKVKQILKDKIIIEEVYEDIFGQKKMNEISLFLHRVEEGGES
jgi:type IV pilus assembly protein PilP